MKVNLALGIRCKSHNSSKGGKATYECGRRLSKERLIELAWFANKYSAGAAYLFC